MHDAVASPSFHGVFGLSPTSPAPVPTLET